MPRLPKILADIGEKGFGIPCSVTEIDYLDANFKRVRFQGHFAKTSFTPGQVTEFRVSAHDFRHYTPSFFDRKNGICDILFYLHDQGPGSKWASALEVGCTAKMLGMGGKMKLVQDNQFHFFFGDETSLGLFHCLKEAIHENGHEYLAVLELGKRAMHWPELIGLSVDKVPRSNLHSPAIEAAQYVHELNGRLWNTWVNASFYLSGQAASIKAVRKALVAKGVNNNQISTYAYWRDGKKG